MKKWHVSKDGVPRECNAPSPDKCRAGGTHEGLGHYDSPEEAMHAYDKINKYQLFSLIKNDLSEFESWDKPYSEMSREEIWNSLSSGERRIIQDLEVVEDKIRAVQQFRLMGHPHRELLPYYEGDPRFVGRELSQSFLNNAFDRQNWEAIRREYARVYIDYYGKLEKDIFLDEEGFSEAVQSYYRPLGKERT